MNKVLLNNANLDGGNIIVKGGSSSGGVTINNQDKVVDIVENGSTEVVADAGYTGLGRVSVNVNVPSSGGGDTPSRPKWTGHADAEGLRAIGWTEEDIAYYQENGVNWNEEDDEYHKVSDDNKALYGVLTAYNIQDYTYRIVYLPKIDTSDVTDMYRMFSGCTSLVAIPQLYTHNVTDMQGMFSNCTSLVAIPQLDTLNVTTMSEMFNGCSSLVSIPQLYTHDVRTMYMMFYGCSSLVSIPQLDTHNVKNMSEMFSKCHALVSIPQLDTHNVTDMYRMFSNCTSLVAIPQLDTSNVTYMHSIFYCCFSLAVINLNNIGLDFELTNSSKLSKDSLLYIINNEAAESEITITLHSYAYRRYANDSDVLVALANHPNIAIAEYEEDDDV